MLPSFSFGKEDDNAAILFVGKEDERPWLIPANAMEHIFN